MIISEYFKLARFKYHITFLWVIVGAVYFAGTLSLSLALTLLLFYLLFNLTLYTGIYILNDVIDIENDKKHPIKKNRPLPSGKVDKNTALVLAIVLILVAIGGSLLFFDAVIAEFFAVFVIINLLYSLIAKKIAYVELIVNSLTHPLRLAMGILLVGAGIPYTLLLASFFLTFGLACVRRTVEKDVKGWEARSVLKVYKGNTLLWLKIISFIGLLLILLKSNTDVRILYILLIGIYAIFVFGIYYLPQVRSLFRSVWSK